MKPGRKILIMAVGAVALGSLIASGCATKKYVRNTVSPLDTRVSEHDKRLEADKKSIDGLESGLSSANERAQSAQGTADKAVKDAASANELASDAGRRADTAREAADKSMARVGEAEGRFDNKLDNLDNYKVIASDNVLFQFGSAELTSDSKAKLDNLARGLSEKKHFVIEVEGFTDKTGSSEYNLSLSRRRADAVVRYLTMTHKMPLWAIHMIGNGTESPVGDNKTRDGRKLNRRVEIRMLAADLNGSGGPASASSTNPARTVAQPSIPPSTTDSPQK